MDHLRVESYTNPEFYIDLEIGGQKIGIYFLLFIAFAEAGLFAGLFFSSDAFLFVAGIYSSTLLDQIFVIQSADTGAFVLAALVALASVMGNSLAYWYGSKAEAYFVNKKDGLLYKKDRLERSRTFFNKYGVWAIIVAHHIPIVRVFIPVFSAVSGMKFFSFLSLITLSSFIWSLSITLLGHYLYQMLLCNYNVDLRQYLWLMIVIILAAVIIYSIFKFIRRYFLLVHRNGEP